MGMGEVIPYSGKEKMAIDELNKEKCGCGYCEDAYCVGVAMRAVMRLQEENEKLREKITKCDYEQCSAIATATEAGGE